jgi:hypothetical protein
MPAYDMVASSAGPEHQPITIPPNDGPTKPVAAPPGFFSKPRNRWLTAGALGVLLLIPAIVVPVVLTQQNKSSPSPAPEMLNGAPPPAASQADGGSAPGDDNGGDALTIPFGEPEDANSAAGQMANPLLGKKKAVPGLNSTLLNSTRLNSTRLNATALNTTLLNGTLLNATWVDEPIAPYVKINDMVVSEHGKAC